MKLLTTDAGSSKSGVTWVLLLGCPANGEVSDGGGHQTPEFANG